MIKFIGKSWIFHGIDSSSVYQDVGTEQLEFLFRVSIHGHQLESEKVHKFKLGVTLTWNLSWSTHIDNIVNQTRKQKCFIANSTSGQSLQISNMSTQCITNYGGLI